MSLKVCWPDVMAMDPWQDLLIHLFNDGRQWVAKLDRQDWRRKIAETPGSQTDPALHIIQNVAEVNSWLRMETTLESVTRKGFVIIPPERDEKHTLMILAPFKLPNNQLSLQLGIMAKQDEKMTFFGYRFESPHGYEDHNYYHAQPIQSFGRGLKSTAAISWYPDNYPSFPLVANDLVELVASVLVSYWKQEQLTQLALSGAIGQKVKAPLRTFLGRIQAK